MRFIREALEACQSCNNQNQVFDSNTDKYDPKAVHQSDATYNDGRGIKDSVMLLPGGLSHAFTLGLNQKLQKKPLQEQPDQPDLEEAQAQVAEDSVQEKDPMLKQNTPAQIGIAHEDAQQMEETSNAFIMQQFDENSDDMDFIANKFDFVEPDQLRTDVVCKTTMLTVSDFLRPSNLFNLLEDRNDSVIDHVVVVFSDALGRTENTTVQRKLIDIRGQSQHFESRDQEKEFNAVLESYVVPNGYKVVLGLEGFVKHLKNLSKELHI